MAETKSKLPQEDQPDISPSGTAGSASSGNLGTPRNSAKNGAGGATGTTGADNTLFNPRGDLRGAEESPGSGEDGQAGPERGLFNRNGDRGGIFSPLRDKDGKHRFKFSKRSKIILIVVSISTSLIVSLGAFFFSSIFNLPNFMKNVEARGFQRYQVDLRGRSNAWLAAYMELRFAEIDDPNLRPADRDNLLFRANNVSRSSNPAWNWYRTLRTSSFEQDVFERRGIKFTSVAVREGNIIKFRAGKITFPNGEVQFDPRQLGYNELDALSAGDVSVLNGRLKDTVDIQYFKNDKEARAAVKKLVREEYPGIFKAVKRFHLRRDIQNMIGVRKWSFFEDKRTALHENWTSLRNRVIVQALPEGSKSGNFIMCLFGLPDCKASSDPADPNAQEHPPTGGQKEADKTTTPKDGSSPQPLGDGSGEPTLQAGADAGAAGADAASVAGKIVSKLIAKAGIFSMLDSLSRFDQAIHNHKLSKLVTQIRGQQMSGLYTTFQIAADQLTTGKLTSAGVKAFMQGFARPTNSEAWATVMDVGSSAGKAGADSTTYQPAKNKQAFCSPQHQAEMSAASYEQADKEFQYNCPQNQIGSSTRAQALENAWNGGPGGVLHPELAAYHAATGGVFDIFNSITSAIADPVINGVMTATHTKNDVQHVVSWGGQQALQFGGATPPANDHTPSGQLANDNLQGAANLQLAAIRESGGSKTTQQARALIQKNILAFQADDATHTSFFNRYLAVSNPNSLFSIELLRFGNAVPDGFAKNIFSVFGSALAGPLRVLTQPAHAAVPDGYAADRFAAIDGDSVDWSADCPNTGSGVLSETPQSVTNADDLGIFKPDELTWDLVSSPTKWYKALYDRSSDEDRNLLVWNCALGDNEARGGIGAKYGYKGEDAYDPGGSTDSSQNTSTASGSFTNPFPGGWTPNRLDQGYDGTFKGQIVAPFDGTVTYAGPFNGWNGSSGVIFKADPGTTLPFPTHSLYFTEGVAPITSLQGKHVTAGTPIANATASPYGAYTSTSVGAIEWGVAQDGAIGKQTDPEAQALGESGCPTNPPTATKAMVLQFSQWAQKVLQVAAPSETGNAGCP